MYQPVVQSEQKVKANQKLAMLFNWKIKSTSPEWAFI